MSALCHTQSQNTMSKLPYTARNDPKLSKNPDGSKNGRPE